MNYLIALSDLATQSPGEVGGKAQALGTLYAHGLNVPPAACIPAEAYRAYLRTTGLGERILLELSRKPLAEMRWEEMWDAALRIRNMFLQTPLPDVIADALAPALIALFDDKATVVRSSSPAEDSAQASFAGLHESYVNVRGLSAILEHVRLVWASLWSDAALLYRQELGLDVAQSAMAVVVQELVSGERSGVVFGRSPTQAEEAVVEAVWGLNQGLVDGTVEPDRWTLERQSRRLLGHAPAQRDQAVRPSDEGVVMAPLSEQERRNPPLSGAEVAAVLDLALRSEQISGTPQDVEWTYRADTLYVLQSRPITTDAGAPDDQRSWYLSLRRSFDNLKALRRRIEDDLIPALIREAEELAAQDVRGLSDAELAAEIERRLDRYQYWHDVYWGEFIPFAHGARLFGQVYNDALRPDDPHEFMTLLAGTELASLKRNRQLEEIADRLRADPALLASYDAGELELPDDLAAMLMGAAHQLGLGASSPREKMQVVKLVVEMARAPARSSRPAAPEKMVAEFLACFEGEARTQAEELLDLARASYRLRDDDNIYLGGVEAQLAAAVEEGRARLEGRKWLQPAALEAAQVGAALRDPDYIPKAQAPEHAPETKLNVQARQLVGQPAGPGLATGVARVVSRQESLFDFRAGEIIICDAIDPTMTFIVPLAAGIVERRGGMLIHGAIIAREYGLPCVTGVPQATEMIHSGDTVTVDGYLGIVIIERRAL